MSTQPGRILKLNVNLPSVPLIAKVKDTCVVTELAVKRAGPAAGIGNSRRGILLLGTAVFFFACMDTTTKYLAGHYNVPLIMAIRYLVHCLLMVVILAPSRGKQLVQTRRTGLVVVRAACLAVGSLFYGLALQRMPVAETTAIIFLAPLLVVLIARPFLHEQIGLLGWAATLTGFAGVLLIVRPGGGLDLTGVAWVLCAAVATVVYQLLSRILATTEQTIALLFYVALVGAICFGVFLPWYWEGKAPTFEQLLLFLSIGMMGGIGHFFFTAAYRHTAASTLAPIIYLQLFWATLLGWIVFDHVPNRLTVLGMGVVAASGAIIAFKSRRPKSGLPS